MRVSGRKRKTIDLSAKHNSDAWIVVVAAAAAVVVVVAVGGGCAAV